MSLSSAVQLDSGAWTNTPGGAIAAIQAGDADAASWMYRRYASGIRFFLRRGNREAPVDDSVLNVILDACRRIRSYSNVTIDQVTSIVLECTHSERAVISTGQARTTHRADLNLSSRVELMNCLFTALSSFERDLLLRSFLLNQTDSEIAQDLEISENTVVETRRRARDIFRRLAASGAHLN